VTFHWRSRPGPEEHENRKLTMKTLQLLFNINSGWFLFAHLPPSSPRKLVLDDIYLLKTIYPTKPINIHVVTLQQINKREGN